jgi:hypothetical protein
MKYLFMIILICLSIIAVNLLLDSNEDETILSLDNTYSYLHRYQDDVYQFDFYSTQRETRVFDANKITQEVIKNSDMTLPIQITGIHQNSEPIPYEGSEYYLVSVIYQIDLFQLDTVYILEGAYMSYYHEDYGMVELPIGSYSLAFKEPSEIFQINTFNASYDLVDNQNIMSGFVVEIVNKSNVTQTIKSIDIYIPNVNVQSSLITYVLDYDSTKKLSYNDFYHDAYEIAVLPDTMLKFTIYPEQTIFIYVPLGYGELMSLSSFFWSLETNESGTSYFDDFPLRSSQTLFEEGVETYQKTYHD